jgi:hypothetical protein
MEGNLSQEDIILLKQFLEKHPELSVNTEFYEGTLTVSSEKFKQKSALKKSLTDYDYIAYYEGDLSEFKKQEVEEFVDTNSHAKKEFELYAKLKLQPQSIVFDNKQALKKRGVVITFKRFAYTAASVAALWLMFLLVYSPNQQYRPLKNIASNNYEEINEDVEDFSFLEPTQSLSEKLVVTKKTKKNNIKNNLSLVYSITPKDTVIKQNHIDKIEQEIFNKTDDYLAFMEREDNNFGTVVIVGDKMSNKKTTTNKLTVKQYLVSKIKKNILKTKDQNSTKLEIDDFATMIAGVSNDKVTLTKKGEDDYINVHTRYFSFNRKISN